MEEFLSSIGIQNEGTFSRSGSYVIDFDTDLEFVHAYNELEKTGGAQELQDTQLVTPDDTVLTYIVKNHLITLTADYKSGIYKLTCTEIK